METKKITIDKKMCKGCGICVALCPKKILSLDMHGNIVISDRENCIGCRQCEYHCPDFAIRMDE